MTVRKSAVGQVVFATAIVIVICGLSIAARAQLENCENDLDCAKLFQTHKLVERKDVDKLDKTELQHFRDGVKAMMARPETDPLSWRYQAFIHGTYKADDALSGQACCQHSSWFFLSWHRMEIYYLERILRALSGDDNFAVPYWNFTDAAAAKRAAPESFRSPTYLDDVRPAPNPLFYSLRRAGINEGKPLCKEVIDWKEAFKKDKFWVPAGMGSASFGGTKKTFLIHGILGPGTGELEDQPHNSVHATVGVSQRESKLWFLSLYSADGAGLDPLFWPIHVNLDRAWNCWQANHPNTLPDDRSMWATQKFKFFDAEKVSLAGVDGKEEVTWKAKEVCLTGKQIVDMAKQLNYKYTDCDPFPPAKSDESEELASLQHLSAVAEAPPDVAWKTMTTPVRLGAEPVTVSFEIPDDVQQRIQRVLAGQGADSSIALELEGIQMNQAVDTLYEIYLNLPSQPELDWQGRYFVGLLNFFGIGHRHRDGVAETVQAASSARSFDITEAVRRLAANNEWQGGKVSVTFVVAKADPKEDCVMPTAPTVDEHISFAQMTLGVITPASQMH